MRTVSTAARRRIARQLPPKRCKAKSSRTREACRRWAMVGGDTCASHGGRAPQVRRKAAERVTVAEALANGERRHPWEILGDVQHGADVLMRDARSKIESGGATVADFAEFVTAMERAHRLTSANVSTGLAERRQRFHEAQADQMRGLLDRALSAPRASLSAEQRAAVLAEFLHAVRAELAVEAEVVE